MGSDEFYWYMAYDRIAPIGPERHDVGVGIMCDTYAKVHGIKGTKYSDFMPDYDKEPAPKKTDEQIANIFKQWAKNG